MEEIVKFALMPGEILPPDQVRSEGFEAVQLFFAGGVAFGKCKIYKATAVLFYMLLAIKSRCGNIN